MVAFLLHGVFIYRIISNIKTKSNLKTSIVYINISQLITNHAKMSNVQVCQFEENLVEELKKFRFSRSTACRAIVMKIDTSKMMLVIDEHYEDTTTEELRLVFRHHFHSCRSF